MAVLMTDPEAKPDTLRIPISDAYMEGRAAFERGDSYPFDTNPYGRDQFTQHLDYVIGYEDASHGVAVEFRALAEENGERI